MKTFAAEEQAIRCAVCDEVPGKVFTCVRRDTRLIALCGPLCEAVFESNPGHFAERLPETGSFPPRQISSASFFI